MAGVFVVVGIAAACLLLLSVCLCRRYRKRSNRHGLRLDGHSPVLQNVYSDESPRMSMANSASLQPVDWDRIHGAARGETSPSRVPMPAPTHFPLTPRTASGFNREIVPHERYRGIDENPFSDYHRPSQIGVAVTTDTSTDVAPEHHRSDSRVSEAPSSPSIYPPSLPGDQVNTVHGHGIVNIADAGILDTEHNPFRDVPLSHPLPLRNLGGSTDTLRVGAATQVAAVDPPPRVISPPRPPRSELRVVASGLLTPPASVSNSSRGHSDSPSTGSSDNSHAIQLGPLFDEKMYHTPGPAHEPEVFLRRTYSRRTPLNNNVCRLGPYFSSVFLTHIRSLNFHPDAEQCCDVASLLRLVT